MAPGSVDLKRAAEVAGRDEVKDHFEEFVGAEDCVDRGHGVLVRAAGWELATDGDSMSLRRRREDVKNFMNPMSFSKRVTSLCMRQEHS